MIELSITDTLIGLFPLIVAIGVYWSVLRKSRDILYASLRMVLQLVLIGYGLAYIFKYDVSAIGVLILAVMIGAAAFIAIRPLQRRSSKTLISAALALTIAGGLNLAWMLLAVFQLSPWYQPQIVIPLAGMVFANGMNAISLAAERFEKEVQSYPQQAETTAFNAAMIPQVNALLAVGLVSLPGMMTGQILSGISPLIAVRYQILIMSMITSTSALSIWLYFKFSQKLNPKLNQPER